MRTARDALLDRQGQRRDARHRAEGVLSGEAALSAVARRYEVEVPRDDRLPRPDGREAGTRPAGLQQPRWARTGHRPVHARIGRAHRRDEDPGLEAGARQVRLRCRLRRRTPRRGEEPRQGAHLLLPLRAAPLGPQEPASRALAPLQRAQAQGREHPCVPDVELDRARHLAVHLPARRSDRSALFRRGAPGRRARRHADHGRRRAHAARARRATR